MMKNKKSETWFPLLFSIVMIAAMLFGYQLGNQTGSKGGFFSGNRQNSLQEAFNLIKMKYVDPVQLDSLEGPAIQEMMNELDPHSVYLPPMQVKEADEELAGNFEGIGVEFNMFNDTVNIVYVIPGGPGDKVGLQTGDKIIKVNDSSLTTRILSTDEIKILIRGEKGSKAILQIVRGNKQQLITVTRDTILVPSIDAAYMMDASTGYIKLNKFSSNSYEEFMQAMEELKKQGLKNLVFDLRGNGGGFMDEAVDIADEFLSGDKLIVYTEGANSKKREYRCKRPGLFEEGKLMLLVDELSASASEVLAGALQDWCRATIIGRRTFGKGLVQEQYPLSGGSALRLTIARYYTPIGRSIQRSYEKGKKVYMDELWDRYSSGEMLFADSMKNHKGKLFITACRDTVYGGGGIMPTLFVPADTSGYGQNVNKLLNESDFSSVVYNYYLIHKQQLDQYTALPDYTQRFSGSEIWDELKRNPDTAMNFKLITQKEKEFLQLRLKALFARYKWRNTGYYQVLNNEDVVIKKALMQLKQ